MEVFSLQVLYCLQYEHVITSVPVFPPPPHMVVSGPLTIVSQTYWWFGWQGLVLTSVCKPKVITTSNVKGRGWVGFLCSLVAATLFLPHPPSRSGQRPQFGKLNTGPWSQSNVCIPKGRGHCPLPTCGPNVDFLQVAAQGLLCRLLGHTHHGWNSKLVH